MTKKGNVAQVEFYNIDKYVYSYFFLFSKKKNFKCKKVFFFTLLSCHFLFILTVLIVVCFKIMTPSEAMALGTFFVDSKHDQNVTVSMDIIITGSLPLTIRRRALSAFQHICLLCN